MAEKTWRGSDDEASPTGLRGVNLDDVLLLELELQARSREGK